MKVLLIVDVQNDFCPGGSLAVVGGNEVAKVINQLSNSAKYDLVVASQDWHPAGHSSFLASPGGIWPEHCVQGSFGAEFHADLDTSRLDYIVRKGRDPQVDSYSAFFDNNREHETDLRNYLLAQAAIRGVPSDQIEVTVCGLATDYCVKFSALDSISLGFTTNLIVDGCRAVNLKPDDEINALREMAAAGVNLLQSREVLPQQAIEREQERGQAIQL